MIENDWSHSESNSKTDRIEITYYTDPLCCWSWAQEPQWRKLIFEFREHLSWHYVMGGLIPDWKTYNDPLNSVTRPVQMGPVWMEAHHISGMPINERIWIDNPPVSSYPACIAFKCAEMQSAKAGDTFLRYLRDAAMTQTQNIAELHILNNIALKLSNDHPGLLDTEKFLTALTSEVGKNAFREDLQKVRLNKVGRFPTITIYKPGGAGLVLTGFRPYSVLKEALLKIAPELNEVKSSNNAEDFINYWNFKLTEREVNEV